MPVNTDGSFTLPSGSTNAAAGQVIASATWDAIYTDIQTACSNSGGQRMFAVRGVNFNPGVATDVAISISMPGSTNYKIAALFITNASVSLTAASVGLYTATGGGGLAVIASTTLTVSGTTPGSANSLQTFISSVGATANLTGSTLQFRILTSVGSAATGDVILSLNPN